MAVHSSRLVGPAVPANGFSTYATVPSGKVWLIRRIVCVNYGGAAFFLTLYLGAAANANTLWQVPGGVGAGAALDTDGRVVLAAGEVLVGNGNGAAVVNLYGYALDT